MFAFEHKVKNLQILFEKQLLGKYYMKKGGLAKQKEQTWPSVVAQWYNSQLMIL
jgi:hypothetical protein